MSKYAKQHHIPVHVLNRFRSASGDFFYFNKGRAEKGVEKRNTEKVFYRRHQYSIEDSEGQKLVEIESEFLSKLDNEIAPIIEKICAAVERGRLPNLNDEERAFWDYYFLTQHFRSPEVLHSEETSKMSEQNYINVIESVRAEVESRWPSDAYLLDDPDFIRRSIKNAPIHTLLSHRELPLKALSKRGLLFGTVENSKSSFIIGSRPVMRYNSGGNDHLADPRTELWLPLSSKVIVSPGLLNQKEAGIMLNSRLVRRHNRFVMMQSEEIGSGSKALLQSLLNPR